MATVDTKEGTIPFHHPTLPKSCETWFKIVGKLDSSSTGRPLIALHGGPGACHNYLLSLQDLAIRFGITIVFYDQVGCGQSTHLPETRLNNEVWNPELFMSELDNLLDHLNIVSYDLLGQSWGGMLAAMFALRQPKGLQKLIISNSPASMKLWVESCNGLRRELPREVDDTLTKYEELRDYENQDYKDAVLFFYQRHLCRKGGDEGMPFPKDVMDSMNNLETNDTVYFTMNGPSEFTVVGNLKDWSLVGKLNAIKNQTLVINGEHDEAQAICVSPFANEIANSTWNTMKNASHMSNVEQPEEYCRIVSNFLLETKS